MRKHKRILWLAVLPMIVGMGVFTASELRATSGGCFFPSVAVDGFAEDFFDSLIFEGLSEERRLCLQQCNDFRTGCKNVCKNSRECVDSALTSFLNAFKRTCNELSGEDRRACLSEIDAEGRSARDFVREDKDGAREDCQADFEDCRAACEGDRE
jgi:hypothetical protein